MRLQSVKNHFVASLGEFVGTFLFLFFAFAGTQTANQSTSTSQTGPDLTNLLYISLIFGFSLAINVWVFFRISGGLFNPAVTLALCIAGVVPILRSICIFIAQILGAIAASAVVRGIIPGNDVLFSVRLRPGTSIAQGLFLEMFLTAELVFTILMLAAEKTKATFVAPVGIGLALFVAELVGVYWTGGALNPARAFGPEVVIGNFEGYHWIYWIGPFLGALLAVAFYSLLKYLNYEEVNGKQDLTQEEEREKEMEEARNRNNENRNEKEFEGRPGASQRSSRSHHHHRQNNDDYDTNRIQRSPRASQRYPSSSPARTAFSADTNRISKAFAPEPPPIRYHDPIVRSSAPPPIETPNGGIYIQDTDAQIRRESSNKRRGERDGREGRNQYGEARNDMQQFEQWRRGDGRSREKRRSAASNEQ